MKNRFLTLITLTAIALLCISTAPNANAGENDLKNIGKFSLGYMSGHVVHELGHIIAMKASGQNVNFTSNMKHVIKTNTVPNNAQLRATGMSGFAAQYLFAEYIFATQEFKDKSGKINWYATGVITMDVVFPVWYMLMDSRYIAGFGDIAYMKRGGMNTTQVKTFMGLHAATNATRLILQLNKPWDINATIIDRSPGISVTYQI